MQPRDRLKELVRGTPLEPIARATARLFRRRQTKKEEEKQALSARYDTLTIEVMSRVLKRDSNCIDVGAARGDLLKAMVDLAPEGKHFAFEPVPVHADLLRETFPGVRVEQMALGELNETAPFRHVLSSPYNSGFERRWWDTYEENVEMIQVRVARLDDVVPLEVPIRFLKVDVEGSERAVFRGARRLLSTHLPYVAFELGAYQDDVFQLLTSVGLRVSLLDDWLAGRESLDHERFRQEYMSMRHWMFLAHPAA